MNPRFTDPEDERRLMDPPPRPGLDGYRKTRTIDLYCPNCKRTLKDQARRYGDPDSAVIAEILCPECCDSTMAHEPIPEFRKANGDYCTSDECRVACERAT